MMVVLVSAEDPGLEIFPTHRLAQHLNGAELPPPSGDPRDLLAFLEDEPRSAPSPLPTGPTVRASSTARRASSTSSSSRATPPT